MKNKLIIINNKKIYYEKEIIELKQGNKKNRDSKGVEIIFKYTNIIFFMFIFIPLIYDNKNNNILYYY
jgi:hypothetical protein